LQFCGDPLENLFRAHAVTASMTEQQNY
jgi:hypothetical protein